MKAEKIAREKLIDALGYDRTTELDNPTLMLNAATRINRLNYQIELLEGTLKQQGLLEFLTKYVLRNLTNLMQLIIDRFPNDNDRSI